MTNRTEAIRRETMKRFGFGPEIMRQTKVCRVCGHSCAVKEKHCSECGTVLPKETLFDLYKSNHLYCPACDTVVAKNAVFCPVCGKRLQARHFWAK